MKVFINDKENINNEKVELYKSRLIEVEKAHTRKSNNLYVFGQEVQMDACEKFWFGGVGSFLHLAVDKATKKVLFGWFEFEEITRGYFVVLFHIIINYGIPKKIKADNRSTFSANNVKNKDKKRFWTQFGKICEQLNIVLETTSIATAKPNVERENGTFKNRLIAELRYKNITNIDEANQYLNETFIPYMNKKFSYAIDKDKSLMKVNDYSEEELKLIEKMRPGLIQLEIGVQSTNESTIKEIRRTMRFAEVARIVKRINEGQNVHQHLDLIAGLPYEDLSSFQKSFDDVYRLRPEQLQLGFLKVLKGSYMEEQKEQYGLIYQSKPPYEVLYTNWLPYEEVLQLKMVEDMVEVYYNSGQFAYTLRHLESRFESPFELYVNLGKYYEKHGLHLVSHSRISRYEILLDFITEIQTGEEDLYRELLTLDLYLRENVKNRPAFAGDYTVSKEMKRQFPKNVHLEKFQYDVMGDCGKKEQIFLFDYENRSKLTHQASCKKVQNSLQ